MTFSKMKTTGAGEDTGDDKKWSLVLVLSWGCLMDLEIKVMNGWLDVSLEFPGEMMTRDLSLRVFSK